MRTRAVLLSLLVLLVVAAPASGYENGRFPTSALSPIYDSNDGDFADLAKGPEAASWNTMNLCANADGVALSPGPSEFSPPSPAATSYRSGRVQLILWDRYLHGGALAARPIKTSHGWVYTSNHGIGRAVDLRDLSMQRWLRAHGDEFGWTWGEVTSEWWHVTFGRGRVNDFDRPDPGGSFRYPHLERGSGGTCQADAVKEVQRRVGVEQDGDFGKATSKGVRRFMKQPEVVKYLKKKHLEPDPAGQVSSTTWIVLRKFDRQIPEDEGGGTTIGTQPGETPDPMAGIDVKAVQGLLNARFNELHRGEYKVPVDGVFGPEDQTAVKRFQILINKYRHGHLKVTGEVDPKTYAALRKSLKPALTGKVIGPDVSEHNGDVDWRAVRKAGASFVIARTGQGGTYADKLFSGGRVAAIRQAKFPLGIHVYHYLCPRTDRHGSVEADFAIERAAGAGFRRSDGPIWADIETSGSACGSSNVSSSGVCTYVESFLHEVEHRHYRTGVYTFPSYARSVLSNCSSSMKRYRLWIAHPGARTPDLGGVWSRYALWQFTFTGRLSGVSGDVDISSGDAETLLELVG